MPERTLDRPDRLRQLGGVGLVDGAEQHGVWGLHRAADAHRHGRKKPDPVRGAQRRQPFRHPPTDLRRDLGGLQRLWRQQPLHVHGRLSAGQPRGLQGRLRGLLQPPVRRLFHDRPGLLVPVLRRIPDDALVGKERLQRQLYLRGRSRQQRRAAEEPQGLHVQRPRRVLVGGSASKCHGSARSGREPRVLQRQRGLLEDALGPQHRRLQHALPDADHLQGDPFQRARRPAGPAHLDGGVAGPALQPSSRRRSTRKRADRPTVRGQLRHLGHHRALAVRQAAAVAQHGSGGPGTGPIADPLPRRRHARLRVG